MSGEAAADAAVRREIYERTLATDLPPACEEVAGRLALPPASVRASFRRLAAARVIVLDPASGEILMANPFAAVPTPYRVETPRYAAFGNWVWDALGIGAMLAADVTVRASCACCGTAMTLPVRDGALAGGDGVVHFGVPARRWWDDIVFT